MKDDIAIKVDHVSKSFRLPHNKQNSLKGTLVNLVGRGDRTFETQDVLKDISFEIKKGEFFGIVGRNGSGKSTLLKMIAGIYEPTKGKIVVNGSLTPFIELGVGFNPELTGRENVYMNGALLGFNNKEMDAMYDDIVTFAELDRFMDQKLKNYSSGMQVRLAFSIAIRAKSDILLLDEVLAVGDAAFQQKCFDYFEGLKRAGQTIVIVTHDMSVVKRFCTRAIFVSMGQIVEAGSPRQISELYTESNIDDGLRPSNEANRGTKLRYITPNRKRFSQDDTFAMSACCGETKEGVFINLSFVFNGFVIADCNSKDQTEKTLMSGGWITFKQSLQEFNGGKYDIYLSLHRSSDDQLLEHLPRVYSFSIIGHEPMLDGPMRLNGRWKAKEEVA